MTAAKRPGSGVVLDGYPKLSAFQSSFPETAIFRKFGTLNLQNLSYMQAELSRLEVDLREIAKEDLDSGNPERLHFNKNWWELSQASEKAGNSIQWLKVLEVREKLNVYSTSFSWSSLFKVSSLCAHRARVI